MPDGGTPGDPFAPLPPDQISLGIPKAVSKSDWHPEIPATIEPPDIRMIQHGKHGRPNAIWVYRDRNGSPLFGVMRFDPAP